MRVWLVVAILLAGCAAPADTPLDSDAGSAADEELVDSVVASVEAVVNETYTLEFGGTLLYRAGSDGPPSAMTLKGDHITFCIEMPPKMQSMHGHLTWEGSHNDVMLQFISPQNEYHDNREAIQNVTLEGPLDLGVENPGFGTWFIFAGPGSVGAYLVWELTLTLVGPAGYSDEDFEYLGEPCY